MGRILDVAAEFLDADGWPYNEIEDSVVLKTGFDGKNGKFTCYAQERAEQEQFVFYSVLPVRVPSSFFGVVSEFITRANFGMIIGNFEMDFNDGELRFKTSVDVEAVDLPKTMVGNMIYANVLTMDRYFPGLMRVIYADVSAQAAIAEIEGG